MRANSGRGTADITVDSPFGALRLEANAVGITAIDWPDALVVYLGDPLPGSAEADHLGAARRQLEEYFAGDRTEFDLRVDTAGTPFQQAVWQALATIPYGDIVSYRDIAEQIGRPSSARPVGGAVGANPVPIVLPCHRVIGSSGTLTGFGPGLASKVTLLELEGHPANGWGEAL